MDWGNRHFAPEGVASQLVEVGTGRVVEPVLVDRANGRELDEAHYTFAAGPAADENVLKRMAFVEARRIKA
jgi:hypothetical protein